MKKIQALGFDSGYDYVKAVFGPEEENMVSFPAAYMSDSDIRERMATSYGNEPEFDLDNISITFEEEKYYIGDVVKVKDLQSHGTKEIDDHKYSFPWEKAKLLAAISLYAPEEDDIVVEDLVMGLAMQLYDDHSDNYRKNYENKVFEFKAGNKKKRVEIRNVNIIPQSLGAYYNKNLDEEGYPKEVHDDKTYGVLDIGGRTLDGTVAQNSNWIRGNELGLDLGVILEGYENVSKITGIPTNIIQNKYLEGKQRFNYANETHNIAALCKKEFSKLADKIHKEVTRKWRGVLPTLETILVTGGGADEVYDFLTDLFETPLELSQNPRFDNSVGFYKIGSYTNLIRNQEDENTKE